MYLVPAIMLEVITEQICYTNLQKNTSIALICTLGKGAYSEWEYEVFILQDDGSMNSFQETTTGMALEISNLEPDTQYQVKVRAKSLSGAGPWSDVFYGKTLKEGLYWLCL